MQTSNATCTTFEADIIESHFYYDMPLINFRLQDEQVLVYVLQFEDFSIFSVSVEGINSVVKSLCNLRSEVLSSHMTRGY